MNRSKSQNLGIKLDVNCVTSEIMLQAINILNQFN